MWALFLTPTSSSDPEIRILEPFLPSTTCSSRVVTFYSSSFWYPDSPFFLGWWIGHKCHHRHHHHQYHHEIPCQHPSLISCGTDAWSWYNCCWRQQAALSERSRWQERMAGPHVTRVLHFSRWYHHLEISCSSSIVFFHPLILALFSSITSPPSFSFFIFLFPCPPLPALFHLTSVFPSLIPTGHHSSLSSSLTPFKNSAIFERRMNGIRRTCTITRLTLIPGRLSEPVVWTGSRTVQRYRGRPAQPGSPGSECLWRSPTTSRNPTITL